MKILCKKDFETPSQLEYIKPGYKKNNHEILFEKGKEYDINTLSGRIIRVINQEKSYHYYFTLTPDTKGMTPYYKDIYYGDYFELIEI